MGGFVFANSRRVTRRVQDRYLPPDHDAFVAAEPPTGRVIVIAPTRAACETIELALGLHIETFLEKQYGAEVRRLAREGKGFGIVAGTGTGKTLAIRPIAEEILRTTDLRVGVVNREREATPETPSWNVVIVTTGIARRWFQDDDILPTDTLVVDEIHQTSAELELCLALGKKVGCRFVWLSATVDPSFYRRYLNSDEVLEVYDFDRTRAARVKVVSETAIQFLGERVLQGFAKEKRGVALFVPTRKGVEEAAEHVQAYAPRINTAFYHGGEPIRILRPFLEGGEKKPFFLAMTAAGQSALNVRGLDTVIIDDKRFTNIIDKGRNVLTQLHLGANEILQMAGRVHGRVEGGRVFILSDRDIQFEALRPTEPEFQLAGDSERVALTCADIGVDVEKLELPVPLDRESYRAAVKLLERRGIIEKGRLSTYGKDVEAMPVDRPWAELLVQADDELVPYLAVMSAVESLHRMTRDDRNLDGLIIPGSDHLTAYNVYAEAYGVAGYMGEVYGLPRHLFHEDEITTWAERRGVLVKSIEDIALAMASVFRAIGLDLPAQMPNAGEGTLRRFQELLARFMPFSLVIDEETADGQEARVSKTSVCGSWGAIAGELRYFADRFGTPRASIEGTQIPMDLVRRYATEGDAVLTYDPQRKRMPLALRRRVEYFGFELEREVEAVPEPWPDELAPRIRRALAEGLARWEARHGAMKRNRDAVESIRETWRRSGGETARLDFEALASWYEQRLAESGVRTIEDFRALDLSLDPDAFVSPDVRERWRRLPDTVFVRDRDVELRYEVEWTADGTPFGVVRLRLPEKLARTLTEAELPSVDRPLRFLVTRGQRGSVRASSLDELQEALARPWSEEEIGEHAREREASDHRFQRGDRPRGRGGSGGRGPRGGNRGRPGRNERARARGDAGERPSLAGKGADPNERKGPGGRPGGGGGRGRGGGGRGRGGRGR